MGALLPDDCLTLPEAAVELDVALSIVLDRVLRDVIPAWRRTAAGQMERYGCGSYDMDDEGRCFSPDAARRGIGRLVIKRSDLETHKLSLGEDRRDRTSKWPWGSHETPLLQHLDAAAREFWCNFDANSPETAPKSDAVKRWLTDRGVSDRVAGIMAQLLRPPEIPAGPRGKK